MKKIPTTKQVRDQWAWNYPDYDNDKKYFDAWLEQVKADAWDEGRNAEPVHDGDHETYCSEYECHCDSYTNPYREETE